MVFDKPGKLFFYIILPAADRPSETGGIHPYVHANLGRESRSEAAAPPMKRARGVAATAVAKQSQNPKAKASGQTVCRCRRGGVVDQSAMGSGLTSSAGRSSDLTSGGERSRKLRRKYSFGWTMVSSWLADQEPSSLTRRISRACVCSKTLQC